MVAACAGRRGVRPAHAVLETPGAYGRVVRDPAGRVQAVVEAAMRGGSAPHPRDQRRLLRFRAPEVFDILATAGRGNAQGEVYLTDAVKILANAVAASRRWCWPIRARGWG